MIYTYFLLLLLSIITLVFAIIYSICHKSKLSSPIIAFLFQNILIISSYLSTFFTRNQTIARILFDFTSCSSLWYLFFFSYFLGIVSRTQFSERLIYKKKWFQKFIKIQERIPAALSIADTILILFDLKYHFLFDISMKPIDFSTLTFWNLKFSYYYVIHISLYSIFITVILSLAVRKIFQINFLFRQTYLSLGFAFIVLIFLNFFNLFMSPIIDISFLCYVFVSILFWHYAYYKLPNDQNHYLLSLFSDSIQSALACFDKDENCIYSNKKCQDFFKGASTAQTTENIESYLKNSWFYKFNSNAVSGEETIVIEGQERFFRVEHQKLFDSENRFTGSFFKLYETTDEILRIKNAKYRATYDELTGLYNRRVFYEKAEALIRSQPDVQRYMVVTNIFNFSLLNDLFGSRLGDTVIKEQARMLSYARYDDVIFGRISSDKCAMLIKKSDFKQDLAEKNTQVIQNITTSLNYKLKIYIGVYEVMSSEESAVSMCDKAVLAINSIRGDYEQTIAFYNSTMIDGIIKQRDILSEFQRALRSNEFQIYLQPVVDKKGKCNRAEALVRWQHPLIGVLNPDYFLESLESAGYIYALDSLVWTTAVKILKEWENNGIDDMAISVNISAKDFLYADLFVALTDLVENYNISPDKLILELQEDIFNTDSESVIEMINSLHQYGFTIELDSFGNDKRTLQLLKQLDISGIKFNLSSFTNLRNNSRFEKYIHCIFKIAKDLNLCVTTVCIEKDEQINMLSKIGSKYFQGFVIDKPMPLSNFEKKYMGGNTNV